MMKVKVKKLEDSSQEELSVIQVFDVTPVIQNAIDLLENQNDACIVQDIKTGDSKKISLSDVIYGEYLERNIFLYTKEDT